MVWRSLLSVPGSNPRMVEKAFATDADAIILDLEDAVAPEAKAEARRNVVRGA
jgi:citrate lyase beta subunit